MADAVRRDDDLFSVDEFYVVIPDGQKADLIDGVIYVASPATRRSDGIFGFLRFLVDGFTAYHELGEVVGSRYAFRLTEFRAPEPDVAFVSAGRQETVLTEREGVGPPDLVVEVVSRDSRHRDYSDKKSLYEEAGVQEYWLIDPIQRRAEFHRLREGRYEMVPLEQNRIFRSQSLPGFWLDVDWLFAKPLPNKYRTLQKVLGLE